MKIKTLFYSLVATTLLSFTIVKESFAEKLTVWAWDPNFNVAAMNEAAARYKKDNPDFSLTVFDAAKDEIEQKLNTMLASGVTSALPDIVLMEDYNALKNLQAYPGAFEPLQDAIDYRQFAPYKVKVMTIEDKIYGIPFDSGVAGLFWRSDYLQKAGFTEADLQNITWDRFIEIGKQVKEKTGVSMLAYDINHPILINIMMQSAGQWFFDKDGKPNILNNKALKATLETIKKINDAKITRPASGWSNFVGAFNSGQVASVSAGVWIMATIKSVPEQSGKWRISPIPVLDFPGSVHASNMGGSSWYVLSSSKNKKLAIDFLNKTFAHDSDMYQKLLVEHGIMSTYLPASSGEAYNVADPFFDGQREFQDFSKWINEIPQVSYGMYTSEVGSAITAEIPALLKGEPIDNILKRIDNTLKYQIM